MPLPRREKIGSGGQGLGWRFDSKNEMAQAYASRQAARYVTRVSAETKAGLQGIIAKSVREGINARDTAKLIKSSVGLNGPQGAAVNTYYNKLIARGTDSGRAWKLADKYSNKLLKSRAKTIARTEIMGALNGGALEQARQRRDAGLYLNPMKKWKITKDEVTCKICRPLEGQVRPLEGAFSIGVSAPPGHPNCRCTLSFFDADVDRAADKPVSMKDSPWEDPRYRNAPRPEKPSAATLADVRVGLKGQRRLNKDLTVSVFHATVQDPQSILKKGLVPGMEKAAGQQWEALHSRYATYFHLDRAVAMRDIEFGGSVIEARIPVTQRAMQRVIPDEDSSLDPADGLGILTEQGGAIAFIGGVPPSFLKLLRQIAPTF